MAIARSTPKCHFCGKPTATARHNNMGKNFVGDTFLGWIHKDCDCEEAKNERERIKKEQEKYFKQHPELSMDNIFNKKRNNKK
jgi:hypothetical protein